MSSRTLETTSDADAEHDDCGFTGTAPHWTDPEDHSHGFWCPQCGTDVHLPFPERETQQ